MSDQETVTSRKRRGPKPTGKGLPLTVRLLPDLLTQLDRWIENHPDPQLSRPEAIRTLLRERFEQGTSEPSRFKPSGE